jgi:hypothetical protein
MKLPTISFNFVAIYSFIKKLKNEKWNLRNTILPPPDDTNERVITAIDRATCNDKSGTVPSSSTGANDCQD